MEVAMSPDCATALQLGDGARLRIKKKKKENGVLMKGISVLIKEAPERYPTTSTM